MPLNEDVLKKQEKPVMPLTSIFFLIDTSGSMKDGGLIDAVNTAMREAIPEVKKFAQESADATIRYHVLEFSTGAEWTTSNGNVEDFGWSDLTASGLTSLGAAYQKLDEKLSRKNGFLQEHANNAPILILLTDGAPTDNADAGLAILKENKWFERSIRIALALPGSIHSTLVDFVGGEEGVIDVSSENLKKFLKVIAVNSATIGSKSKGRSNSSVKYDIIKEIAPDTPEPQPVQDSPKPDEDGEDIFGNIFDN